MPSDLGLQCQLRLSVRQLKVSTVTMDIKKNLPHGHITTINHYIAQGTFCGSPTQVWCYW